MIHCELIPIKVPCQRRVLTLTLTLTNPSLQPSVLEASTLYGFTYLLTVSIRYSRYTRLYAFLTRSLSQSEATVYALYVRRYERADG
jgi:hypothetical protein